MKIRFLLILTIAISQNLSFAQSGHYWTQHYGTRSILLSNSAIGGVKDLGALYYNPGRLSLIKNPAFLLNADVYEYSRIKLENAVGDGLSKSKSDFGGVPGYAAGTFKVGFLKGHSFGYSILYKHNSDMSFGFREEVYDDVLEQFPGEEYFGAYAQFDSKTREQWYSLSWSYPFSETLSVGVTMSGSRFSREGGTEIELQALTNSGNVAQYQFDRNYKISQYGLLWKMGIAGIAENFNWGVTLTTPTIKLKGDGSFAYENYFSGISDESESPDIFTSTRQDNLQANYSTPLAIGAGISIPLRKSELHISTEWYSGLKKYQLLEAEPYVSQSSGDTITFVLIDDLKSVINVGIGGELFFSERVSGFASFSTDFSAVKKESNSFASSDPIANNSTIRANFYHMAAGILLNFQRADLTIGASYTGAKQSFARPIDFPEEGDDGIFDQDEDGRMIWNRFRIVFSFSFPFLDDIGKKIGGKNDKEDE